MNRMFISRKVVRALTLVLLLVGSESLLFAQNETEGLTVDSLLNLAMQNNDSYQASLMEVKKAEALQSTFLELPKAAINVQYGHLDGPNNNLIVEATQEIPFPSIFFARYKEKKLAKKRADMSSSLVSADLKMTVRTLFEQIRYIEARLEPITIMDSVYNHYLDIILTRQRAGEGNLQELRLAKMKRKKIALDRLSLEQERKNAYMRLGMLVGVKNFKISYPKNFVPLELDETEILEKLSKNPKLKSALLGLEEEKVARATIISEQMPDFVLGYINSSAIGEHIIDGVPKMMGLKDRFSAFSVGVNIPLSLFSSASKIKASKWALKVKEFELNQIKKEVRNEWEELRAAYRTELLRYRYYAKEAIPEVKEMMLLAKENYELGDTNYLNYIEVLETSTEITEDYLSSCFNLNMCVIKIYNLIEK